MGECDHSSLLLFVFRLEERLKEKRIAREEQAKKACYSTTFPILLLLMSSYYRKLKKEKG